MAQTNFYLRPQPIDPAVFFDLVKIRRIIDDASNLAVRAASGVSNVLPSSGPLSYSSSTALGLGFMPPGRGPKLSAERRHRLRVDATQKLSRAYYLDEIASSVAMMQSASALEEVASLVLQRNSEDADAKYVHFFHEKIPSRMVTECTAVESLDDVVAQRPGQAEPLRTRASVKTLKGEHDNAAADLTDALRAARFHQASSFRHEKEVEPAKSARGIGNAILPEDQHPSSLEMQILFQRAGVYLTIACQHVHSALPEAPSDAVQAAEVVGPDGVASADADSDSVANYDAESLVRETELPEHTAEDKEAEMKQAEACRMVKANAKRAVRDYLAYLSNFEYSPNLPSNTTRRGSNPDRSRPPRTFSPASPTPGSPADEPQKIYTLNELFAAAPLADLPPYPSMELAPVKALQKRTTEAVTFHPLLSEALHALLLSHCLLQTSTKELIRHAYMVARLVRLADGYPLFQYTRSPARADWIEVLRSAGGPGWVEVAGNWETLCSPEQSAPASGFGSHACLHTCHDSSCYEHRHQHYHDHHSQHGYDPTSKPTSATAKPKMIMPAEPVASQRSAEEELKMEAAVQALVSTTTGAARLLAAEIIPGFANAVVPATASSPSASGNGKAPAPPPPDPSHKWYAMDTMEYPVVSERVTSVARWIMEAPHVSMVSAGPHGGARRRKRGPKPESPNVTSLAQAGAGIGE